MDNRLSLFCDRVLEGGWLAAAVVVPLFFNVLSSRVFEPDKLTLLRSIALVMAAAWAIKVLVAPAGPAASLRGQGPAPPLAIPVLLLAGVYILTTALSVTPQVSFWGSYQRLQGLATNLSYLTIFFLVAHNLRTRAQMDRLIIVMVLTSLPVSLYGIAQHLKLDPLPWGGDVTFRVTSTMGNAIFLAAYLIMVVPLTLARLVQSLAAVWPRQDAAGSSSQQKHLFLVAGYASLLGLQLTTVLFTKSRGPWIGLGVGIAFLALLWLARARRTKVALGMGSLFVLLSFFALLLNLSGSPLAPLKKASVYMERLGTILDMESGTNKVRTLIWFGDGVGKGAAGLITANPFRTIIGYGPESMYVAYNPYYPPDLAHYEARNATPDRSHNDLLDYLVTTGFLGLFAYLLVLARAYSVGLQRFWQEASLYQQGLLLGILSAVTAHLVESITGIAIASSLTYLWLLLGALMALVLREGLARPSLAASPTVLDSPSGGSSRRKRRKEGRRIPQAPAGPPAGIKAWRLLPLSAYLLVTLLGTVLLLRQVLGRGLEPPAMVIGGYGWLLLGILLAAFWVDRPRANLGRIPRPRLLLALGLGLLAILLPIKLFLGTVIADIYFKNGQVFATSQRYDLSVPSYLDALRWDPDQDYYFLFLGQSYLELARTSREEKAPLALQRVEELSRVPSRSLPQLGRENLFQAALVALQRARELNPLNTDHSANLARLYRLWGEVSSDSQAKQEKFAQSVEYYRQAVALSPNAAHLRAEWGLPYYFQGQFPEALQHYQEAQKLDPLYPLTYAYQGDLYRAAGNEEAAITAYQKALELNQHYGGMLPVQRAMIHSGLGELYFRKGRLLDSVAENLKVVEVMPQDLATHRNLAFLYRELGNRQKALEEASIALSLAPPDQKEPLQAFIAELQRPVPPGS